MFGKVRYGVVSCKVLHFAGPTLTFPVNIKQQRQVSVHELSHLFHDCCAMPLDGSGPSRYILEGQRIVAHALAIVCVRGQID